MKNEKNKKGLQNNLRLLAVSAFLAALSIICGKYLALSVGNVLRFSFENLPILLAGMMFGPLVGMTVGVVADLIGCLMVAYATYNRPQPYRYNGEQTTKTSRKVFWSQFG